MECMLSLSSHRQVGGGQATQRGLRMLDWQLWTLPAGVGLEWKRNKKSHSHFFDKHVKRSAEALPDDVVWSGL